MCVAQFSTNELPDFHKSLAVKSSTGQITPFSRDRLFLSLYQALGHADNPIDSASGITDTVISKIIKIETPNTGLLQASDIAKTCQLALKRYDRSAAGTYSAYHARSLRTQK